MLMGRVTTSADGGVYRISMRMERVERRRQKTKIDIDQVHAAMPIAIKDDNEMGTGIVRQQLESESRGMAMDA